MGAGNIDCHGSSRSNRGGTDRTSAMAEPRGTVIQDARQRGGTLMSRRQRCRGRLAGATAQSICMAEIVVSKSPGGNK